MAYRLCYTKTDMKGGKSQQPLGYTIVEVMVVLAISGVMLLLASQFISGKQEKTSFTSGVNEMASLIQDTIEQVTDGKYSDIAFSCQVSASTPYYLVFSPTLDTDTQGRNDQCVFIGKLLHFYNFVTPNYEVFSLAGARFNSTSGTGPPSSLAEALPAAIDNSSISLTTQETIPQSLNVKGIKLTDSSGATVYPFSIGFVQSLGSLTSYTNPTTGFTYKDYNSGAQTVGLIYAPGIATSCSPPGGTCESTAVSKIQNNVKLARSATLCLTDGTQYAEINIGDASTSNNQLSVNVNRSITTC